MEKPFNDAIMSYESKGFAVMPEGDTGYFSVCAFANFNTVKIFSGLKIKEANKIARRLNFEANKLYTNLVEPLEEHHGNV